MMTSRKDRRAAKKKRKKQPLHTRYRRTNVPDAQAMANDVTLYDVHVKLAMTAMNVGPGTEGVVAALRSVAAAFREGVPPPPQSQESMHDYLILSLYVYAQAEPVFLLNAPALPKALDAIALEVEEGRAMSLDDGRVLVVDANLQDHTIKVYDPKELDAAKGTKH
jgi:hypothetical protein